MKIKQYLVASTILALRFTAVQIALSIILTGSLFAKEAKGENIFVVRFEPVTIISMMHYSMLPYSPAPALSALSGIGGGWPPIMIFYGSYAPTGQRKKEKNYFYNYQYPELSNNVVVIGYN